MFEENNVLTRRDFLRMIGTGAALISTSTLLEACGGTAPSAPSAPPAAGGAATKAKVSLSVLAIADDLFLKGIANVLTAFQQSENGKWSYVDIAYDTSPIAQLYQKTETSVAAGTTWDLLMADGPQTKHYAYNKVVRPLQEFFSADELKQWVEASVLEGSYKGSLYAAPMMQSASLMFYNVDLLQSAGINPPKDLAQSWTMDQALDAWQKATQRPSAGAIPTVWGIWTAQGTLRSDYGAAGIFRRSAGKKGSNAYLGLAPDGITASGYFDAPESIAGMQVFQDLSQKLQISPVQPIPDIFTSKLAAFQISPDNTFGAIAQKYPSGGFNVGVTGIPYFKDGTQLTHTGSWNWAIGPSTKHLDEAVAFLKFATGQVGAKVMYDVVQQIPAHLGLLKSLPEYSTYPKKMFLDALTTIGIPRAGTPGYQEYSTLIIDANNSIVQGANVGDTMHATAKKMDEALAKYKGWNS